MFTPRNLLITTALLSIAACSNGTSSGPGNELGQIEIDIEEQAARIFADDTGDVGDALSDGDTLTARQVAMAGIELNYNGGPTRLKDTDKFTVRVNDDGEITLELENTEMVFSAADREVEDDGEVYGYFTEAECEDIGFCVSLSTYSGEIDDLKENGNGYHAVLNAQSNQVNAGPPDLKVFAVVGTETRDSALSGLGSATYEGRTRFDITPAEGFLSNSESRNRIRSDVTLNADFGAGTISGVMDALESRGPTESDYTALPGTVAMRESTFSVNGFQGRLAPDATFNSENEVTLDPDSKYSGAFFGPNAEEVGGTFSISGSDEDGDFNGIGFFSANQ